MPSFPRDNNHVAATHTPPRKVVLEETYDATISATTEVTLNASTEYIEVAAIDKAILMKWGTGDASTSDFDAVIPQNTVRQFFVPDGITAVNFIEQSATAILAVTEYA